MTLRILHLLDHSLPLHSGYVFRTLSILKEQRKLGWETYQLTSPKQGHASTELESFDGWEFYRTPPSEGVLGQLPVLRELQLMRAVELRLEELAVRLSPHVIHAHSPVLNGLPATWVGRRLGIPVVYEMRASWEDAAVDHGTTTEGSLRYRLSRWLETQALRRANQVTTICEGLRGDIIARGISPAKITVIPNAVDVNTFEYDVPPDEALRSELGLGGATVLGFAGSFYGYEGLDLVVAAMPRLLNAFPDIRALFVGGGPQESALKAQVASLGLDDRVIFTGRVPHSEVHRYYNLIDVLVYARKSMRLTDLVTPLKPLEAMAQGRLLVASYVGGHRELIQHGHTGLLFEAGNVEALARSITEMLTHRDEWERMKRAGRSFVESERNWTNSAARYREVYSRLLPAEQQGLLGLAGAV